MNDQGQILSSMHELDLGCVQTGMIEQHDAHGDPASKSSAPAADEMDHGARTNRTIQRVKSPHT